MRELRVEDALLYLDQVKVEFGDRPHIYNEFLDIMKTFKTQQIDTPGVIRRVSNLFQGNKKLVLGFNTFLPEGYKIELPLDGDGPPVAVFRAPGETVTHILSGPGAPPVPPPEQKPASSPPAAATVTSAGFQPRVAGQGPLRAGPPLGHAAPGVGERGPLSQQPVGLGVAAAGVAAGFSHAQQASLHLQQQGGREPPRPPMVQPPSMMPTTDAVARARLEQQTFAAAASTIAGRGPHVPPPPIPPPGARHGLAAPVIGQPQQQAGTEGAVGAAQHQMGMQPAHSPTAAQAQQQPAQQQQQQQQQQPGMEFDHAINYVTTIKKRFANEPETYKKFLEILHTYQKEQRGIKEVLEEVSVLFSDHSDLLKEFTYFLPDAVQSEAKAQLEQAVRENEARKKAAMSKQAIMQQAQRSMPHVPPTAPSPPQVQQEIHHSSPTRPTNPIPFGATMGRSRERESEIYRSAVYGLVSFAPVRPPRKNAPNVTQAAAKNGRPSMLPPLPPQPNTSETAFLEKAKRHLNRRELAPDKPSATRARHTPYMEFLKCLHLFGAGVLNKEELVLLLRGLFMQGHAPKSGINMGGGASNPAIANDAHELLKEFEEKVLVGRGPYAEQETYMKDKSKYGSKRSRDFDYRDSERPTPSYATLPGDYPTALFMSHTGQLEQDSQVLNNTLVCVGANKVPGTGNPEDYDAMKIRRNAYEEAMFRIEDERFEVDMAIERNALAMRQIEPIAEEVAMLRETEEKDGQPIGRLQYKLRNRSLSSIQINSIGRIYGEKGDEVIQHLARNPLAAIPIVYQRLRQKDQEWRKQKSDLMTKWKTLTEANYEGGMDFLCYQNKREIERSLTNDRLLEECKKARSFCSSLEKRSGSSVSFGLSSPDRSAILYEPYAVVEMKPGCNAHQFAVRLILQQVSMNCAKKKATREKVGRIWSEFVMPFFDYPVHWILDEARESFQGELNNAVVQYSTGQHVRTAFGDGVVLAFLPGGESIGPRYRIKFPFGVGFVAAYAVMHGIQNPDGVKFVRRDGMMEKDADAANTKTESAVELDPKFKLLFGSENIYLFMRLYSSLVSSLDDIESFITANPNMEDSDSRYHDPMKSQDESKPVKLDFAAVMTNLKRVISEKFSNKDFEAFCRKVSPEIVHKMAAIPKMVQRASSMMMQTAQEDLLLSLFDHCQYTGVDPVQLRDTCLALSPEAAFRIQYNTTNGRLYFSYLPESEILSTVMTGDVDDDDDDDDDVLEDGEVESDDDDDDDDIMDVEDEEEDLRQVKRVKLR